jgi:glyoxylase I family protein
MEITAIHHIALTVTDIERSRRFYREVLSIREVPRPPFSWCVVSTW